MLPIQSMLGSVWPNDGPNTYALQAPVDENASSGKNHGDPNVPPWADPSYVADQWQSLMGQGWGPRAQTQFKSEDGSEPVPAARKKINEAECLAQYNRDIFIATWSVCQSVMHRPICAMRTASLVRKYRHSTIEIVGHSTVLECGSAAESITKECRSLSLFASQFS